MRAVVQRVTKAQVEVDSRVIAKICSGLLVLLGVAQGDTPKDADYLVEKIINLRIFEDNNGKMNLSLLDTNGEILVVSQFTLLADCRKGRRPAFVEAADPKKAKELYQYFIDQVKQKGVGIAAGEFQALMEVSLVNHGPVTIILDSRINSKK